MHAMQASTVASDLALCLENLVRQVAGQCSTFKGSVLAQVRVRRGWRVRRWQIGAIAWLASRRLSVSYSRRCGHSRAARGHGAHAMIQ